MDEHLENYKDIARVCRDAVRKAKYIYIIFLWIITSQMKPVIGKSQHGFPTNNGA